jgi:hypothetical protein
MAGTAGTPPTISSGFGTSPSITANGTGAMTITTGSTGAASTGMLNHARSRARLGLLGNRSVNPSRFHQAVGSVNY